MRDAIDGQFSPANYQLLLTPQIDRRKAALINKYTVLDLKFFAMRALWYLSERTNARQGAQGFGVEDSSGSAFGVSWKDGALSSYAVDALEKAKKQSFKKFRLIKARKTPEEAAGMDRDQETVFQITNRVQEVCL